MKSELYANTPAVGLLKGFSPVPHQLEVDVVVPHQERGLPRAVGLFVRLHAVMSSAGLADCFVASFFNGERALRWRQWRSRMNSLGFKVPMWEIPAVTTQVKVSTLNFGMESRQP
jgi:hypothetical protein